MSPQPLLQVQRGHMGLAWDRGRFSLLICMSRETQRGAIQVGQSQMRQDRVQDQTTSQALALNQWRKIQADVFASTSRREVNIT